MYKYLSKKYYNRLIIDYDKKELIIKYIDKQTLNKVGSYIIKVKKTIYLDNIYNLFLFNNLFNKELKKHEYIINIRVNKSY